MSWWQALETGWPGLPMLHQSCKWTLESGNNATKMMKWYVKMFNWGSLILNLCSKTFQNGLWANFPMSQKYPRCFGQSPKIALQNWLEIQSLFPSSTTLVHQHGAWWSWWKLDLHENSLKEYLPASVPSALRCECDNFDHKRFAWSPGSFFCSGGED